MNVRFLGALALIVLVVIVLSVTAVAAQEEICVVINDNQVCGSPADIAVLLQLTNGGQPQATSTPNPAGTPEAAAAEETSAAFTGSASYEGWELLPFPLFFDTVGTGDELWLMPLGTHMAVDTSQGRYEGVVSAPVGLVNGVDQGYCGEDQYDCPPHAFLGRVSTSPENDVEAVMDISYRIFVHNGERDARSVRVQLRYNNVANSVWAQDAVSAPRTPAELLADYNSLASDGDLGLFVAMRETLMNGVLAIDGRGYEFGYSCWDCLAHTQGPDSEQPLPLNHAEMSRFGTPTPPLASSLLPGRVIPIPSPEDEPEFMIDFEILIPAGETAVVWLGRYDLPDDGVQPADGNAGLPADDSAKS